MSKFTEAVNMSKFNGLVLLLILLVACADKASESPKSAASQSEEASQGLNAAEDGTSENHLAAGPAAPSVLQDIFKQPVSGEIDQKLQDNRMASYWFGYGFLFKGKSYWVGYANTSESFDDSDNEYPEMDDQVSISTATYELNNKLPKLLKSQDKLGKFGANGKAAMIRANITPETFELADQYLLAIPVRSLEMGGIEQQSSEVFVFSAKDYSWRYAGNIYTGENDDANCVDKKTPSGSLCSASTGKIEFVEKAGDVFPTIKVIRKGTEIDSQKKIRHLAEKDFYYYSYSVENSKYEQLQN